MCPQPPRHLLPSPRDAGFVQAAPPVREVASAAAPGPAALELVKTLRGSEEPILSRSETDHSFGSFIPRERRRHRKPSEGQRRRRGQLGRALRWGPRPRWVGRRLTARPRAALYPECVDGCEPRAPCPLLSPAEGKQAPACARLAEEGSSGLAARLRFRCTWKPRSVTARPSPVRVGLERGGAQEGDWTWVCS